MTSTVINFPSMTKQLMNPTNRIREWRANRGLTLAKLSDRTGIHTGYLSKMELGERPITLDHFRNIARHLGVDVGDLLIADDNPRSLTERERFILDSMREDPSLAHNVTILAENRIKFTASPEILPFKRSK